MLREVLASLPTNILFDIGIILIAATILAYILKLLKQPLIPAYILAGVLLGPYGFKLITNFNEIKLLSELGIAFLLFMVGLEIDFKKLRDVGSVSVFGGLIKTILLFLFGFIIASWLGFLGIKAVYFGLIIAFSSTMVVVKLLSDKEEIGTLHGRIILGILLLEDILAVMVLSALTNETFSLLTIGISVAKGIGMLLVAYLISRFILPVFFKFSAKSQELLFLTSISICLFFALASFFIGFSIVVGAFIAGLSLANLPYNYDIAGQVKSLRDFFSTLFFVSLGMSLYFTSFRNILIPLLILLGLVLIIKPILITILTSLFGYRKRTSFLTGLDLAQISEFSLIIFAQGLILGHISQDMFSITLLVAIFTMGVTPYLINNGNKIYSMLSFLFNFVDKLPVHKERELYYDERRARKDIVLFGCHRMGSTLLKLIGPLKKKVFIVDYDPDVIKNLRNNKIPCMYGDITNEEVLKHIGFNDTKIVISTIPDLEINKFLVDYVKDVNKRVLVFLTANHLMEAIELYGIGADYIILPQYVSGEFISGLLSKVINNKKLIKKIKDKHIEELAGIRVYGKE